MSTETKNAFTSINRVVYFRVLPKHAVHGVSLDGYAPSLFLERGVKAFVRAHLPSM